MLWESEYIVSYSWTLRTQMPALSETVHASWRIAWIKERATMPSRVTQQLKQLTLKTNAAL